MTDSTSLKVRGLGRAVQEEPANEEGHGTDGNCGPCNHVFAETVDEHGDGGAAVEAGVFAVFDAGGGGRYSADEPGE